MATIAGKSRKTRTRLSYWIEARQRLEAAQTAQSDYWDAVQDLENSLRALFPEAEIDVEGDDIIEGVEFEDLMEKFNLKEEKGEDE
jgi:uncharacterized protein YqjF (DUF2071 family)